MKSSEVRLRFRDVINHITRGGEVVVEHYNRSVAIISPYTEPETEDTTTDDSH